MYICDSNEKKMKTLTLEIDENSKKGKVLFDFLVAFYSEKGDVQITAINGLPINKNPKPVFIGVAENDAKYKTTRKAKKESKKTSDVDNEESPYNPEFVKMVLAAEKRAEYTTLDPDDVWGSLKLR